MIALTNRKTINTKVIIPYPVLYPSKCFLPTHCSKHQYFWVITPVLQYYQLIEFFTFTEGFHTKKKVEKGEHFTQNNF